MIKLASVNRLAFRAKAQMRLPIEYRTRLVFNVDLARCFFIRADFADVFPVFGQSINTVEVVTVAVRATKSDKARHDQSSDG